MHYATDKDLYSWRKWLFSSKCLEDVSSWAFWNTIFSLSHPDLLSQPMIGVHFTEPQGEGCWVGPQTHTQNEWHFTKEMGSLNSISTTFIFHGHLIFWWKGGVVETGLICLLASCQNPSGGPNFLVQQGPYVHGQSRSGPGRRTAVTDSRCYNGFS